MEQKSKLLANQIWVRLLGRNLNLSLSYVEQKRKIFTNQIWVSLLGGKKSGLFVCLVEREFIGGSRRTADGGLQVCCDFNFLFGLILRGGAPMGSELIGIERMKIKINYVQEPLGPYPPLYPYLIISPFAPRIHITLSNRALDQLVCINTSTSHYKQSR